jgi:pyruvate-formate lyase
MFADLLDGQSASNLEFGEDAVARFDGEAVHEGLGNGLADPAGAVKGDVAELVS